MLRLDKSNDTQTLAIHLNTTASLEDVALVFSQSYDLSSGVIPMSIDRIKGKYYIGNVSGSQMPSPSGQYSIDVYEYNAVPAVWGQVAQPWGTYNEIWSLAGDEQPVGESLRSIRAWVEGDNEPSTESYTSPDENGKYTTYNS